MRVYMPYYFKLSSRNIGVSPVDQYLLIILIALIEITLILCNDGFLFELDLTWLISILSFQNQFKGKIMVFTLW